ncbi:hypothetical protein [Devosia sp. Naph2]|uniref:hypothetical protein n=1 Tax=Devosia polycyclovorans TaxID=3345148 RepID=UPI0035D0FCEA
MSIYPPLRSALTLALLWPAATLAMAPLSRPAVDTAIAVGQSAPFSGTWSATLPTREATEPVTFLASCDRPIRIEVANDTHIFHLGPDEVEADAAIELIANADGTDWQPIAGGPAFFSLWVTEDQFYLYDAVAHGEPDWSAPYVYKRCG